MAGYTPAANIGSGYETNGLNYGQYSNQGYSTLQYVSPSAPTMSLARAAWLNATSHTYMSRIPGMSTVDYAAALQQRSKMFWDSSARTFGVGFAQSLGYMYLNAGNLASAAGKVVGGFSGTGLAEGMDLVSSQFYNPANWADGTRGVIGRGLHRFGQSGEYGIINKFLWHRLGKQASSSFANLAAQPFEGVSSFIGETWSGMDWSSKGGNFFSRLGFSKESIAAPKNVLSGWFNKFAGTTAADGSTVPGAIEGIADYMAGSYQKVGSNAPSLFSRAASYIQNRGAIAGLARSGARIAGGLGLALGYFAVTGAALDFATSGVTNALWAGEDATTDAALQFTALKDKIFNNSGKVGAEKNAEAIAEAIRTKAAMETGVTTLGTRAAFGKTLDTAIQKKSALYGLFAQYGLTGKSSSADEFIKKAEALEQAVSKLSKAFGATTSRAIDMVRVLKSQGIGTDNLVAAGNQTLLTSGVTGYTTKQVMSIQSHGSEAMRGTMFDATLGVSIANDVMRKTAIAGEGNPAWQKTLFALRGRDSTNVMLTRMMSSLAKSTDVRRAFIASLYEQEGDRYVYTGRVNQEALSAALSGGKSYIMDRSTQDLLTSRYQTELTREQRSAADLNIQQATSKMSASQFNTMLSGVFNAAGYKSKEAGLAVYFTKQGLSPQVAASLAKAMAKDTSTSTLAAQFKIDAMRQLNNKLASSNISTSILSAVGDNLSLGMLGTLASYAGKASSYMFGRQAGAAEAGAFAGATVIAGLGSAAAMPALAVAGTVYAAGSAYANRQTISRITGLSNNTVGGVLGNTAIGMSPALLGGGAAIGAISGLGYIAGGATIMGGYLGGKAGSTHVGNLLARGLGYTSVKDVYRKGHSLGAGILRTAGGSIGGAAVVGAGAFMLGALSLPVVAAGAVIGGAVALKDYFGEASAMDAAEQRDRILNIAQSVVGLTTLTDEQRKKLELRYVASQRNVAAARQHYRLRGDVSAGFIDAIRGMEARNAREDYTASAMKQGIASNIVNNLSAGYQRLYNERKSATKGISIWMGHGEHGYNEATNLDMFKAVLSGGGSTLNANTSLSGAVLRGLRSTYQTGNSAIKQRVLEMVGGLNKRVLVSGVPYKSIEAFLKSNGSDSAIAMSSEAASRRLSAANAMFGYKGDHIITEAQSTRVAGILMSMSAMSREQRDALIRNKDTALYYANKYGLSETVVTGVLSNIRGKNSETLMHIGMAYGDVGVANAHRLRHREIAKLVNSAMSGQGPGLANLTTEILSALSGGTPIKSGEGYNLLAKLDSVKNPNRFVKSVRAILSKRDTLNVEVAGGIAGIATANEGKGLDWKTYHGAKGALSNAEFNRIAGDDKLVSAAELSNFAKSEYAMNQVNMLLQQQQELSPKESAIEKITKSVEVIAKAADKYLGHANTPSQNPAGVTTPHIPIGAPKTSEEGGN